jgi:hypothetical protein
MNAENTSPDSAPFGSYAGWFGLLRDRPRQAGFLGLAGLNDGKGVAVSEEHLFRMLRMRRTEHVSASIRCRCPSLCCERDEVDVAGDGWATRQEEQA